MKKVYACLTGNWVCLNDDPECVMGTHRSSPSVWFDENAEVWAPIKRENEHTYYQLDYIQVYFRGKDYRINPLFIQIVDE